MSGLRGAAASKRWVSAAMEELSELRVSAAAPGSGSLASLVVASEVSPTEVSATSATSHSADPTEDSLDTLLSKDALREGERRVEA
jgi:hypothetical protein